jgi:hypothetical protein
VTRSARWQVQLAGRAAEDEVSAGQEVVKEAAGDAAGLIEPGQGLGRQVGDETGQVAARITSSGG